MMTTKMCSRPECIQTNPQSIENFFCETASPDGKSRWCKECFKAYRKSTKGQDVQRRYRQSEKCKIAARRYNSSARGRATRKRIQKKHRATEKGRIRHRAENQRHKDRHPQRNRARKAVTAAIKSKEMIPAGKFDCVSCDSPAEEYHHHMGYTNSAHWLSVIPLCTKCHNDIDNPRQL